MGATFLSILAILLANSFQRGFALGLSHLDNLGSTCNGFDAEYVTGDLCQPIADYEGIETTQNICFADCTTQHGAACGFCNGANTCICINDTSYCDQQNKDTTPCPNIRLPTGVIQDAYAILTNGSEITTTEQTIPAPFLKVGNTTNIVPIQLCQSNINDYTANFYTQMCKIDCVTHGALTGVCNFNNNKCICEYQSNIDPCTQKAQNSSCIPNILVNSSVELYTDITSNQASLCQDSNTQQYTVFKTMAYYYVLYWGNNKPVLPATVGIPPVYINIKCRQLGSSSVPVLSPQIGQ